ncbi:UNVERIFIED_ORG: 2-keto-3-deoxy-L-rhamnonate aldolase RhmA [Paraburkholderia sediminicola]|nr:2-keto-3-deoxy-L-rhamnonate aldolase RhmA [Paraburkholderia sediminicola]
MAVVQNAALHALQTEGLALGFGISCLRGVAAAQLARTAGYHWLAIDMEHGALSLAETAELCAAALATGIAPIVRINAGALDEATRTLDNGAQGIIVPHVESAEEARAIVDALRYPPLGKRTWGGTGIHFGYRVPSVDDARSEVNDQSLIIAMMENAAGVENANAIAAVDGIDLLFVGMLDLSIELGVPQQFEHPIVLDALSRVARACETNGKILGLGGAYDEASVKRFIPMGARFIAGGSDHGFVLGAARSRALFLTGLFKA